MKKVRIPRKSKKDVKRVIETILQVGYTKIGLVGKVPQRLVRYQYKEVLEVLISGRASIKDALLEVILS